MFIRRDKLIFDLIFLERFTDEFVPSIYMFCSIMKRGILDQFNRALIVDVNRWMNLQSSVP